MQVKILILLSLEIQFNMWYMCMFGEQVFLTICVEKMIYNL
jgi:hypothetical protein